MVVGESTRTANIMEGIGNTGDVRMHDHRLRLKQRFDIVRKLGQGTYGKVQLGINKKTGQEVAIKTIKKCKIESDADLVRIRREVQIMSSVRHPNIVHIYEVFENSEKMILVMEYCSGGELYDYLSQQKVLPEDEARRLFRQIATAVYYCHIHKICHRDLKLENVLLDETGSAKIADFGLSNVFKETSLLATFCGSPLYASPEIVKGTPYIGPEVDCWSLGVLLYTLVYGAMPFDGSNFKRLVRQISNGDYFEPKSPSSASPLIRDMLTVDPVQRADITYICDNPWVNQGYEVSCLEMSEALATETPVRLDLLLSLAPPAPERTLLLPADLPNTQSDPSALDESATDLTSSTMAVEPSTSAEKRILDLVAEGGADAIKPSPTRTIVSAGAAEAGKRKLEQAASTGSATAATHAPHRKKERAASTIRLADVPPSEPPVPEEPATPPTPPESAPAATVSHSTCMQPSVKSSATVTMIPTEAPQEEAPEKSTGARPRVLIKKKLSPTKSVEEKSAPEKLEEAKIQPESPEKPSGVAAAADKLTGLSLAQPAPAPAANHVVNKPKKLSIAGMSVGSFKEQFERRASLTSPPDVKKNLSTKPVGAVSKIAKPKAQSEDRDMQPKPAETSSVRLQQIGIEPSPAVPDESTRAGGVKKTESEPCSRAAPEPGAHSLQDARRSLQNSMALLSEQRAQPGEDGRRRAARDIISTVIKTGKPPMPYGRSSSAGVTSLASPPLTPPAAPPTAPVMSSPRTFRTEALHTIGDHRNRSGTSVERIIPIQVSSEDLTPSTPVTPGTPVRGPAIAAMPRPNQVPLRRLTSETSTRGSECGSSSSVGGGSSGGEPIKKSAREFIIPIAVEGKGYVTPRQGSLEPEAAASVGSMRRHAKPRRISLVSGGESEDEDDMHMHKLRSSRAARAESVSSGEEEDDEGFQLLTAENLFSTLLHRVRALTNRLNGEEGTGLQHPHSLFNNLQSPFFNSPHLPRHHRFGREGWPTAAPRDLAADFDTMFSKRSPFPRGSNIKKSSKQQTNAQLNTDKENSGLELSDLDLSSIRLSEKELEALSGLTPALSRRLQKQLLAHLPPAAARTLRRTLSMQNTNPNKTEKLQHYTRSLSASKSLQATPTDNTTQTDISSACSDMTEPSETAALDSSRTDSADAPVPVEVLSPRITTIEHAPKITTATTNKSPSDEKIIPEAVVVVQADEELTRRELDISVPEFSTLPRLKRHSILSRESTPQLTPAYDSLDATPKLGLLGKDLTISRGSSVRSTPDRSLLSKYLTPERTISLEESYSSDSGSLLSDPSYIAAYGSPSIAGLSSGGSLRRHSMRLQGDQSPRKRISRFLRPDFFDTPKDENVYSRNKKDKELETQKILKEIREKRNKTSDATSPRSPISNIDVQQMFKDEMAYPRPCLSPLSILTTRERSRSTTPYYPMLHNIKESALDSLNKTSAFDNGQSVIINNDKEEAKEKSPIKESKLIRPKSFPIKSVTETLPDNDIVSNEISVDDDVASRKSLQKESKLTRPKSYPTSSPSPEKVYVTRNNKKDDTSKQDNLNKIDSNDIEVSFRINLPKTSNESPKTETHKFVEREVNKSVPGNITVPGKVQGTKAQSKESQEQDVASVIPHLELNKSAQKSESSSESMQKSQLASVTKGQAVKTDIVEEKKPTIKKKIIKKVCVKSKSVENGTVSQETSNLKTGEKKKFTRKIKEKESATENEKSPVKKVVTKKKSVLQSIGHKLEKLTSSKSNSPEKEKTQDAVQHGQKSEKVIRNQREHSVPVQTEAEPTESSLMKRAVTLTNVAGLDHEPVPPLKTTVSKVLGLFKKFEPKEKPAKQPQPHLIPQEKEDKIIKENEVENFKASFYDKTVSNEMDLPTLNNIDKPKRPTSLLLNGLGRKNKYSGAASDSALSPPMSSDNSSGHADNISLLENKNAKNPNLKLDFSRLPRVKTNSSPKSRSSDPEKFKEFSSYKENGDAQSNGVIHNDKVCKENQINGSDKLIVEAANSAATPRLDKQREGDKTSPKILYCGETTTHHPHRNHESIIPEKEDMEERIRRKSFYTRFNEKRHKRKSSLVGPGAQEYNPAARLHSQPGGEPKYEVSPSSPNKLYDLSPTCPTYDLSPTLSGETYRSFNPDSPLYLRHTSRLDNYGASDRLDNYRSLDRSSTRKYARSYLDPDGPASYTTPRYARTTSLLDSGEGDKSSSQRDQHKYNRTLSMYSPGNYATYRPKRARNPAIMLKECEKEMSPENILEKIRERKRASAGASTKEAQSESEVRSNIPPKSESDGAERP